MQYNNTRVTRRNEDTEWKKAFHKLVFPFSLLCVFVRERERRGEEEENKRRGTDGQRVQLSEKEN